MEKNKKKQMKIKVNRLYKKIQINNLVNPELLHVK